MSGFKKPIKQTASWFQLDKRLDLTARMLRSRSKFRFNIVMPLEYSWLSKIRIKDDVMKIWKLLSCVTAVTFSVSAMAVSVEENTPFAALQWTFGAESVKPDVVIGYRSVDVDSSGDVSGWQGSVSYRPEHGVDKLKLEGVTGDEDIQYTYGGGYSLQHHKPLVSAGINGSYLTAGADYVIGSHKIEPYVGLTTLSGYDVPREPVAQQSNNNPNPQTVVNIDKRQTAVNNNLQVQHFPEFRDCNC